MTLLSVLWLTIVTLGALEGARSAEEASGGGIDRGDAFDAVSEAFARDGYAVVPGFASTAECDGMMSRMAELVDAWDPATERSIFRTDEAQVERFRHSFE